MNRYILLAAVLCVAVRAGAQEPSVDTAAQNKAMMLLSEAAMRYDYSSPQLKPWHLVATYQLYDLKGQPTQQGTWEYWWISPKVYRRTWTRAGAERSEWTTAEGALYRKQSGEPLKYFERELGSNVISPMPRAPFNLPKMQLQLNRIMAGSDFVSCVTAMPQTPPGARQQAPIPGTASEYCFDPATLALQMATSQSMITEYNRIVKFQERYLARDIAVLVGDTKVFSVSVDKIEAITPSEGDGRPAADAELVSQGVGDPVSSRPSGSEVTLGSLLKKTQPAYPREAKASRVQGIVLIAGIIGKDGKLRNLEVLASPSDLLTKAALDSVKNWEYKPYLLNGAPAEVETVVNVMYSLAP